MCALCVRWDAASFASSHTLKIKYRLGEAGETAIRYTKCKTKRKEKRENCNKILDFRYFICIAKLTEHETQSHTEEAPPPFILAGDAFKSRYYKFSHFLFLPERNFSCFLFCVPGVVAWTRRKWFVTQQQKRRAFVLFPFGNFRRCEIQRIRSFQPFWRIWIFVATTDGATRTVQLCPWSNTKSQYRCARLEIYAHHRVRWILRTVLRFGLRKNR